MRRGNISKRGGNSYQIKFEGPKVDSKRSIRYATVRGTYKDAQKELTRLLGDRDTGKLSTATRDTVREFLGAMLDGAKVSPKRLERYRELAERQIYPYLGDVKLRYITRERIKSWHSTLLNLRKSPQPR